MIEGLDLEPKIAHPEHLPCSRVGAGDLGGAGACLLGHSEDERGAAPVDHMVGDPSGDDLPAERVLAQLGEVALTQPRREILLELLVTECVLG